MPELVVNARIFLGCVIFKLLCVRTLLQDHRLETLEARENCVEKNSVAVDTVGDLSRKCLVANDQPMNVAQAGGHLCRVHLPRRGLRCVVERTGALRDRSSALQRVRRLSDRHTWAATRLTAGRLGSCW